MGQLGYISGSVTEKPCPPGKEHMKRFFLPLLFGLVPVLAYASYMFSGLRVPGPADKLILLAVLFPGIICLSWAVSGKLRGDPLEKVLGLVERPKTLWFLGILSLALLAFTAWMAIVPLEGTAKGGDEAAHLFQARIFAQGRLSAPAPPVPQPERFFPSRHLIIHNGKWFCQYTPTHSVFMAPFVRLNASYLLGPVQGVLSLLGIFLLIRFWTDERKARLASVLLLLSPFFLFMTSTHMAHNSNLMLVTWSLYLLSRFWRDDRYILGVASGFLLGLAATTKPYPIVIWGLFLTAVLAGSGRRGFKALSAMALGCLPPLAGFLATNLHYTGDPLKTPYQISRAGRLLGFGPDKAWYPVYGDFDHTLWRALKNGVRQVASGATTLFGWPLLSLVPLAASLPLLRRNRRLLYLFLPLPGMFLLLLPHAWPAVIYGPRHYTTFLPVVLLLSVLGLGNLRRAAQRRWGSRGSGFMLLTVAGLFAITILLYIPEEITRKSGPWLAIDGIPLRLAQREAEPPAVIFMEASEHGYPHIFSGINHTSPFLEGDYIFCAHQTPGEDREFMELFPDRGFYLYYMDESGEHRIEPWSPELAESLTPARHLHPDPTARSDNR